MAFSYERYERQQRRTGGSAASRSALGYWIPLAVTVTVATAGVVAWVWNERSKGGEDDDDDYEYYTQNDQSQAGSYGPPPGQALPSFQSDLPPGQAGYGTMPGSYKESDVEAETVFGQSTTTQDDSIVAQMRGAIRRTPSPQKMLEGASKKVAAGMAAVGKGLSSIGEEKGEDYVDHERWSEEAESRERSDHGEAETTAGRSLTGAAATAVAGATGTANTTMSSSGSGPVPSRGKRRTVAVVLSAESTGGTFGQDEEDSSYHIEHASLLSHLVGHVSPDAVQLLILIFAPHLQSHPLSSANNTGDPTNDLENDPEAAESRIINSYTSSSSPAMYNALATEAASLVSHPTHIMPFTTPVGHVHLLKHLAPNLVYMQESLCGPQGEIVQQIEGWVGQCVVVIGAEGAGLVDTETEDEGNGEKKGQEKWWMDERRVGLGKGTEVVEGMRMGEDWSKRVETR